MVPDKVRTVSQELPGGIARALGPTSKIFELELVSGGREDEPIIGPYRSGPLL